MAESLPVTDFVFPVYVADEENAALQKNCFSSFTACTPQPYRTIVVDNGSEFGVGDAQAFADVYVRVPAPCGFARAVNIGWRLCEAPWTATVNNDLLFSPGWFPPVMGMLEKGEAHAVAPADQRTPDLPFWSSCFIMARETREKIGYFDDIHLPYRLHDQDFWIRASKLGFTFRRCPASHITHFESATFNKLPWRYQSIDAEQRVMMDRWGVVDARSWYG